MFRSRRGLLLILIAALAGSSLGAEAWSWLKNRPDSGPPFIVDQQSRSHILDGDASGGGHRFGAGRPCKSEFPQGWSDAKIIGTVESIAANDNIPWRDQRNGRSVTEISEDGLIIRVVADKDTGTVVTAYPINVRRNPCPAANDNRKAD